MMSARLNTLASLRGDIARVESHDGAYQPARVALGHAEADAVLQGGLARGAMHEVFAEAGRQSAAATGFIAGLSGRIAARRPLLWVRQDFAELEAGALSMSGFAELGLNPRLLVSVRAAELSMVLRPSLMPCRPPDRPVLMPCSEGMPPPATVGSGPAPDAVARPVPRPMP